MSDPNETDAAGCRLVKYIQLRVGDSVFHTTTKTLQKSNFFARYFDFNQSDGIYFVDANGEHFEHILNFLRYQTAPLFWNGNGFEYAAYGALRAQAVYFQVWELVKWIDDEMYCYVVEERVGLTCLKRQEIFEKQFLAVGPGSLSARIISVEKVKGARDHGQSTLDQVLQPNGSQPATKLLGPDGGQPTTDQPPKLDGSQLTTDQLLRPNSNQPFRCPRNIACHRSKTDCGRKCKKQMAGAANIKVNTDYRILIETHNFNVNLEALFVPPEEDTDAGSNDNGRKRKRDDLLIQQDCKKMRGLV